MSYDLLLRCRFEWLKYAKLLCAEEGEQAATGPTLASFSCRQTSVFLGASASDVIEINFLPFSPGNKFAVLVLSNPHVGEFLYTIDAEARLPMATSIPFRDDENSARITDPRSTCYLS